MINTPHNAHPRDALRRTLQALPKIDLHRHLEGSLRLSTLAEIAAQNGTDMTAFSLEELRPMVQVINEPPDFQAFLAKFEMLRRFYSTRESVLRIAYEVVADAAHDNVKYLELRFNPVAQATQQGFSFEDVTDWVIDSVKKAEADFNITVRLIITLNRAEPQFARYLTEIAVDRKDEGIVAIDLVGDEERIGASKFIDTMLWAKAQGLHITVHAGECQTCPAANVKEAVNILQAERIGHGVHAMDDLQVMDLLRRKNITLEICPTSNLQTAAVPGLAHHPLLSFHQVGIPVTINTDDPSVSNITLTDEYLVAMRGLGVSFADLKAMILNAARAAFLPPAERQKLVAWFNQALQRYSDNEFA
jgi:adenosine deaminase